MVFSKLIRSKSVRLSRRTHNFRAKFVQILEICKQHSQKFLWRDEPLTINELYKRIPQEKQAPQKRLTPMPKIAAFTQTPPISPTHLAATGNKISLMPAESLVSRTGDARNTYAPRTYPARPTRVTRTVHALFQGINNNLCGVRSLRKSQQLIEHHWPQGYSPASHNFFEQKTQVSALCFV